MYIYIGIILIVVLNAFVPSGEFTTVIMVYNQLILLDKQQIDYASNNILSKA